MKYEFKMTIPEWRDMDTCVYRQASVVTWQGECECIDGVVADFKDWLRSTGFANETIERIQCSDGPSIEDFLNKGIGND